MNRVRLFQVIASSTVGGAEEMFAALLRGLDRDRFEVSVACHGRDELYDEYARHADRISSLDLTRLARPSTVLRLARLMRETRADIVHTHLWTADTLGGLAARLAGVTATVATVTGAYHLPIGVTGLRKLGRVAKSRAYRAIYRLFDRVITCSEYVANDLRDRAGVRVSPAKIDVVHNGVDPASVERAAQAGRLDPSWLQGSPIIATVANFYPIKGHAPLIRAMPRVIERFPQARFVLVGDGPSRGEMEALVDSLGIRSHVVFTGRVPCGPGVIAASDLMVMPSISEGLGVVLLEALVLGTPVVATRTGGIPEVVGDDEVGLLAPPGDSDALAQAIVRALGQPDETRRRAQRGRQLVRERFTVEAMVRQTEQVYLGLMNGRYGGES